MSTDFNGALDRLLDRESGYYDEPEEDETPETDPQVMKFPVFQRLTDKEYRKVSSSRLLEWTCPACGVKRMTFRAPAENSDEEAQARMIRDHIEEGCGAYRPT